MGLIGGDKQTDISKPKPKIDSGPGKGTSSMTNSFQK